ncbi:uncharacterized protein LOC116805264 isoform X2 [Drosophila grimshawi]|uniref:uncharacterized protein LOC116805264 isoform X2 n=1 Tax=Drosophila grimshawi TaxID=7222 RepID=UPI000C8714D4|nr:uncharacterized protein LOC116805264 isoform X2 [Drosophila grimshawi]
MNSFAILLLLLLMSIAINGHDPDDHKELLQVKECPDMPIMQNVEKTKLLGVWYAYATTPLPFTRYQRHCASYNVKNNPAQPTLIPTYSTLTTKTW